MKSKFIKSWQHSWQYAKDRMGQFVNKPESPKALLKWRAPEFYLVKKSIMWGIIISIVFIALFVFFTLIGEILSAAVILLFLILVLKYAYSKPEVLDYQIDSEGIRISGWLHPFYDEILSYWIVKNKNHYILYFQTRSILSERLSIPFKNQSPKKAAKILSKFISEYLPPRTPKVLGAKK